MIKCSVICHSEKQGNKKMKKSFETPIVKVIVFETQDVLAAGSGETEADQNKWSGFY